MEREMEFICEANRKPEETAAIAKAADESAGTR